jgi:hypothetical protein
VLRGAKCAVVIVRGVGVKIKTGSSGPGIPVVVNGPVGLPPPRSADVAPVPLVAVLL